MTRGCMFSQWISLSLRRFGLFLTASAFLVAAGTLSLFAIQIAHRPDPGQTELACAKAKLEAMWGVELPEEVIGSVPGSRSVSVGWDLKELGCSGAIHPTASLDEIFGADFSYTAAILPGGP